MIRRGSAAPPIALFSLLLFAIVGSPGHAQGISPAPAPSKSGEPPEVWASLAKEIFHGARMEEGADVVGLKMPVQFYDSSLVPVTITLEKPATTIRKLTLVIDQNPAPLAATFAIGPQSGLTMISTRVRINNYTDVHLVAERLDGSLHDVRRWVLAADGCSAISAKNRDEIAARMGAMDFSDILAGDVVSAHRREAQVTLRHPNYSGMQMDHTTGHYIPARYIDHFVVKQGDDLIFEMTGGISMSEDPTFRFTYQPNGARMLSVEARDSDGTTWKAQYPVGGAS